MGMSRGGKLFDNVVDGHASVEILHLLVAGGGAKVVVDPLADLLNIKSTK